MNPSAPENSLRILVVDDNRSIHGDFQMILAAGMDDFVSKPVRLAELQAALDRWPVGLPEGQPHHPSIPCP